MEPRGQDDHGQSETDWKGQPCQPREMLCRLHQSRCSDVFCLYRYLRHLRRLCYLLDVFVSEIGLEVADEPASLHTFRSQMESIFGDFYLGTRLDYRQASRWEGFKEKADAVADCVEQSTLRLTDALRPVKTDPGTSATREQVFRAIVCEGQQPDAEMCQKALKSAQTIASEALSYLLEHEEALIDLGELYAPGFKSFLEQ